MYPILEKELIRWFILVRSKGIQILACTIREKAMELDQDLKIERFQALKNLWHGFRTRNSLSFRKVNLSSTKPLEFKQS